MKYNAKKLPYDQPGAGSYAYGVNDRNVLAKLNKLYGDYRGKGITGGGNESIFNALQKNTARSLGRSPNSIAAQQFNQFLNSGQMPANADPGFAKFANESLDYGLRETGRSQQHKKGFWDSTLGKIAGVAASTLGSAVAGPVGSLAASAITSAAGAKPFGGIFSGGKSTPDHIPYSTDQLFGRAPINQPQAPQGQMNGMFGLGARQPMLPAPGQNPAWQQHAKMLFQQPQQGFQQQGFPQPMAQPVGAPMAQPTGVRRV